MRGDTQREMTLIDHLDELRTRIIISLVSILVCAVAGWFVSLPVMDFLITKVGEVQYFAPSDAISARLKVTFFLGIVMASPVVITELWLFVSPGLYRHEKKFILPAVIFSVILFAAGGGMGISVLGPTIKILEHFGGPHMVAKYSVDKYIGFATTLILMFGVVFEIPIVMVLLAKLGVVNYKMLAANRKYAFLIIFGIAAIATPGTDPLSMLILAIPLQLLFEASLVVIYFMKKKPSADIDEQA